MVLRSSHSHSSMDLFIDSFQKYSLNTHYAFGTGPGSKETKMSPTQVTELEAFAQVLKADVYVDEESKQPQIPTGDTSRRIFQMQNSMDGAMETGKKLGAHLSGKILYGWRFGGR